MKYLKWPLAALRWVWSYVLRFWYWLEDKHYDPPPVSLRKLLGLCLMNVIIGVLAGYWMFHAPKVVKIPAMDKLVSALPAVPEAPKPPAPDPVLPAIVTAPVLAPVGTDKAAVTPAKVEAKKRVKRKPFCVRHPDKCVPDFSFAPVTVWSF